MNNTYSFADVTAVISHPSVGNLIVTGQGVGSITITKTADVTAHDRSADGTIMVSKIAAPDGAVSITFQQTSEANKWFTKWYNYLIAASASEWADTTIVIKAPTMQELINCFGVSPQKFADKPFQAQGSMVTWNLMAASVNQNVA
ncbi:MAG: phage protein [Paludibacteraceae bacterium]